MSQHKPISEPVTVVLDRWPSTESEFEGLITALRLEFTVQAERRRNGEPAMKSLHYHDLATNTIASILATG